MLLIGLCVWVWVMLKEWGAGVGAHKQQDQKTP